MTPVAGAARLGTIAAIGLLVLVAGAAVPAQEPAVWTPDSSDLLFASGRDGDSEIYILRAGQTDWLNLTNHPAGDNWPVWSPDGARVAFQSNRTGNLDIWTIKTDGTELRQLTDHPEPDYLPSWSPDGRTMLFTSWRRETDAEPRAPHIYAMNPDGSGQRRLVRESLKVSAGATWSPDGTQVVYSRQRTRGADIYVADAAGGNERRLTDDESQDLHNGTPTFSPDGRLVAFYSANGKSSALVVMAADGSNRRTVLSGGNHWYPRWSPDGRWLVYTTGVPAEGPAGAPENIDILAVRVDGPSTPIRLVASPRRDQEASWRPR